jgi:three-Cys-motif partner protein
LQIIGGATLKLDGPRLGSWTSTSPRGIAALPRAAVGGHPKAKHDLLLAFFNKWVSIHSETFAKRGRGLVRIYDGFAGPGVYSGGEPGSPLILMRALCTNPRLHDRWSSVRYELRFVERHQERAEMLERKLSEFDAAMRRGPDWAGRVRWSVTCGLYEEHVPQPVSEPSALFLFLDPFGYSYAPMTLTQDLVQQPKSDTLIFLPLSFVNRFAGREGQERAMDRFFGTSAWREVPDGPGRPDALLELFQDQLRSSGLAWVLPFRLKPEERGNAYWIVGGSSHLSGFASIKEGYWAVDPVNGQGFAAPRTGAPGQGAFTFEEVGPPRPDTRPLLAMLRDRFGRETFTVEDAIAFTQTSRFLDTHLKRLTLGVAEAAGELDVRRPTGARQFKEGTGITMRFRRPSGRCANMCS